MAAPHSPSTTREPQEANQQLNAATLPTMNARSPRPEPAFVTSRRLLNKWYSETYGSPLPMVKTTGGVVVIKDTGGVIFGEKGTHRARLKTDFEARDTLARLGFEVLPSAGSGNYLRLRWSPPEQPFSLPTTRCDLGSTTAIKKTMLSGAVPALTQPEQAQAALRTLYQTGEFECYRQLARDLNRLGIPVPKMDGKPFVTMVPELKDIEIRSIRSCQHRFYQGQKAPSYEVKIRVRDRTVRLVGPDYLDWDAFVTNVRDGLQDLAQTSFLRVVKQVVVDVGSKGASRAYASARCLSGKITFFRQPDGSYRFTDRIFHHEVGHLIADRVGGLRFLHRLGRHIVRTGEDSSLGCLASVLYQAGHPGQRFEKFWKEEGSHTKVGEEKVQEGFAEVYAGSKVGEERKISRGQRRFVVQLSIPNTFASSKRTAMNPNPVKKGT